jgi:hypothetical protein
VGVPAAPRIDDRLRRFIADSSLLDTPAEVTRAAGDLAWRLALPRPSYQQVRELLGGADRVPPTATAAQAFTGRMVIRGLGRAFDVFYRYPAPGLEVWYRRYKQGRE